MTILESVLSASSSAFKTTQIVTNAYSAGGAQVQIASSTSCKLINSGALTAGVLSGALLNITGSAGEIILCGLRTNDATARTIRLQVIVDGFTCFDATSNSILTANSGIMATAGYDTYGGIIQPGGSIYFKTSCVIKVASSLTETDKIQLMLHYQIQG